jgi:hypothetical protein
VTTRKTYLTKKIPQWLLAIISVVIGFYFRTRSLSCLTNEKPKEQTLADRIEELNTLWEKKLINDKELDELKTAILKAYLEKLLPGTTLSGSQDGADDKPAKEG